MKHPSVAASAQGFAEHAHSQYGCQWTQPSMRKKIHQTDADCQWSAKVASTVSSSKLTDGVHNAESTAITAKKPITAPPLGGIHI